MGHAPWGWRKRERAARTGLAGCAALRAHVGTWRRQEAAPRAWSTRMDGSGKIGVCRGSGLVGESALYRSTAIEARSPHVYTCGAGWTGSRQGAFVVCSLGRRRERVRGMSLFVRSGRDARAPCRKV
jgi:hypothetical protein